MTAPGPDDGLAAVLAIDGGNSKTDLALVGWDGTLLATVRGPGASHEDYGIDGAMRRLGDLVREVAVKAGLDGSDSGSGTVARHAETCRATAPEPSMPALSATARTRSPSRRSAPSMP